MLKLAILFHVPMAHAAVLADGEGPGEALERLLATDRIKAANIYMWLAASDESEAGRLVRVYYAQMRARVLGQRQFGARAAVESGAHEAPAGHYLLDS